MQIDTSSVSDEDIIAGIKAGNQSAFETLVRQFHQPMKAFAMTMVDESSAEECVQEALMVAIRSIDNFQGRSSLKTWLLSITANHAKMNLRKTNRETSLESLTEEGGFDDGLFKGNGTWAQSPMKWQDSSPEELLVYEEFRKCLDKTVKRLPDIQKSVIMLRDYQGLTMEEICNVLGVTASNIRVLIHRGRSKVYKMIEHFEKTGEC